MRLPLCAGAAALLLLAASGSALGEPSSPPEPRLQLAQSGLPTGPTARATRIGRLGLAHPAIRPTDAELTGLLSDVVRNIAEGVGRVCSATEIVSWTNAENSSERAQEVFIAFDQALHLKGYDAVNMEVPVPDEKEAQAAHTGILAYSAFSRNANADDPEIVFLWYFEADTMHLALCRSEPKKEGPDED